MRANKNNKGGTILLVVIAFAIAVCVGVIVALMDASANDSSSYTIIGTLLSAILSALIILLTTTLTLNHSQKQLDEQLRLQSLPFITLDMQSRMVGSEKGSLSSTRIIFHNIGGGPAIDLELANTYIGHISPCKSVDMTLNFPNIGEEQIKFKDLAGRRYTQNIHIENSKIIVDPPQLSD